MKHFAIAASVFTLLFLARPAHAQEMDMAFGFGSLTAPSASSASGDHAPESLGGGLYLNFSGDFLIHHRLGVSGEVVWRASRNLYAGVQPYRPLFYDFNAMYAPRLGRFATAEMMAGIGAESLRVYQGFTTCGFTGCTNYVSSNHFMGHIGGGIRLYAHGNFFIRPEAHLYLVHNNSDFSAAESTRYGISIGYSFRPPDYY